MTTDQVRRLFYRYMNIEVQWDKEWAYRMDTLVGLMVE